MPSKAEEAAAAVVLAVLAVAIVFFVLAAAAVAVAASAVVELASMVLWGLDEEEVRCCLSGDEILLNIDAASAHGPKDGDAGFSFIVFWCREGLSRDDTQSAVVGQEERSVTIGAQCCGCGEYIKNQIWRSKYGGKYGRKPSSAWNLLRGGFPPYLPPYFERHIWVILVVIL